MKYAGQDCPMTESIKAMLGCTCSKEEICSGFCTFPVNGQTTINLINKTPGILWTENNNSMFFINAKSYNSELYANTNIEVNDDLEIYFIPEELLDNFRITMSNLSETTKIKQLKAIFQRIWIRL